MTLPRSVLGISVSDALEQLLDQTRQRVRDRVRSSATLGMQEAHVRYWLAVLGAGTPLSDVDEAVLDALASKPRERRPHQRPPAGPATLRKRLGTLREAFRIAHRRRQVERIPAFPPVLAPLPPLPQVLERYADAYRLFESLPRHRAEWYWVQLWLARRPIDVEDMVWSDVSLDENWVLLRARKTKRPAVKVPIPKPLAKVLREMYERDKPQPSDHLVRPWPSRKTTLPRHCQKLRIPIVNATALRHTSLSWIVRTTGITPAAVKFAGHSSPRMMERFYVHALPPQLRECTEALDSMAVPPTNDNGGPHHE